MPSTSFAKGTTSYFYRKQGGTRKRLFGKNTFIGMANSPSLMQTQRVLQLSALILFKFLEMTQIRQAESLAVYLSEEIVRSV